MEEQKYIDARAIPGAIIIGGKAYLEVTAGKLCEIIGVTFYNEKIVPVLDMPLAD